jgi:hypothetical protein
MTKLNDTANKGRESILPPVADIAAEIRKGAEVGAICIQYGVSRSTLQNRFHVAGYTLSTGEPHAPRHDRPAPLESQHVGAGGQHVGGGDYQGLPTTAVKYRGATRRSSIDWDQITEQYVAAGGQVDASVWPQHGKVVVIGSNSARSSRANIHSFEEATEYKEPAAPKDKPAKKPRARKKAATSAMPTIYQVQPEQRPEIRRRYEALETIADIALDLDVSAGSIRYAIEKAGGRIRSKKEAAALRLGNAS